MHAQGSTQAMELEIPAPPQFVADDPSKAFQTFSHGSRQYWAQRRFFSSLEKDGANVSELVAQHRGKQHAMALPPPLTPLKWSDCAHSDDPASRIFFLGWQKTGTTSFTDMLRLLGFRSQHNIPQHLRSGFEHWVATAGRLNATKPPAEFFAAEAFSDVPFVRDDVWPLLAKAFPHSRFVLVEREEAAWVRSLTHNFHLMLSSLHHGSAHELWVTRAMYNVSARSFTPLYRMLCEGDTGPFVRAYRAHNARVRTFFETLPEPQRLYLSIHELSVANISRLAAFLGCGSHAVSSLRAEDARRSASGAGGAARPSNAGLPSTAYCVWRNSTSNRTNV